MFFIIKTHCHFNSPSVSSDLTPLSYVKYDGGHIGPYTYEGPLMMKSTDTTWIKDENYNWTMKKMYFLMYIYYQDFVEHHDHHPVSPSWYMSYFTLAFFLHRGHTHEWPLWPSVAVPNLRIRDWPFIFVISTIKTHCHSNPSSVYLDLTLPSCVKSDGGAAIYL